MSFRHCRGPGRQALKGARRFVALAGIALLVLACSLNEATDAEDDGLGVDPSGKDDDSARPGTEPERMPEPADPGAPSDEEPTEDLADPENTSDDDAPAGSEPSGPAPLTWHGRVQPILEARCFSCHKDDGIGPFPLTNYEHVVALSALVRSAVEDRRMPPMPADDRDCRPLSDARLMLEDERAALGQWIDEGMPEGDPSDAPNEPPPNFVNEPPLGDASERAMFDAPYSRTGTITDDYRCMVIDPGWERAVHLKAIGVEPDNTSIVHHVIVYAQLPEDQEEVDALVDEDTEPGYECFGDAGFSGARAVGSFVPGAAARAFPGGATLTAPAGTRFVLQMHYNFLAGEGEDQTSLAFWRADASSGIKVHGLVMINANFVIPTDEADFTATATSHIVAPEVLADAETTGGVKDRLQSAPGLAWGVSAHMHLHGKSARIDLVRKDGSEECLLDIPKWDFDWQGDYRFRDPVELFEGDSVRLTCNWDNSADNQPVINGERLPSGELSWGEGSLEEMCLSTLKMTPP